MSTGAENYRKAQDLLDIAAEYGNQPTGTPEQQHRIEHLVMAHLAAAQVHATLAHAAAAAYPAMRDWMGGEARDGADWVGATAPTPRPATEGDDE